MTSEDDPSPAPEASDPEDERIATSATDTEAPPAPRGQRRQLQKVERKDLAEWSFFVRHKPRDPLEVVFRGPAIGSRGGAADVIGLALHRLARLYETLGGASPHVESVVFGHSLHLALRPSNEEVRRAESALADARRVEDRDSPEAQAHLAEAVTNVQVAAALAADLLRAHPAEAPAVAAKFGTEVAQAYKSFASTLAKNDLDVAIESPERERRVRLSSERAREVQLALEKGTEPRIFVVEAVGTLSIADATQHGFGLRLDPGVDQPRVLRDKQMIRGEYARGVGETIRDRGLWGKRVRALIRIERDAVVSTSTIRPPTYTLVGVETAGT